MTAIANTREKPILSLKTQVLATCAAIAGAVALPQLFHMVGALSGLGTAPGEIFLPIHLPVILVGLLAGPFAGAAAGLLSPLVSFALSGMPGIAMLPFMVIELAVYGLTAGCLYKVQLPTAGKVLAAQIAGRIIRAAAILIAVSIGNTSVQPAAIWNSILTGLPGLILQWVFLPLIVFWVENRRKKEK